MTKSLRLDDEANEELEAAATWYEARRSGLGHEFVAVVRASFVRILAYPRAAPLARECAPSLGVRKYVLRRFPYSVVYVELEDEIRILAIAHGRREPGFWRHRR